MEENKKVDPAGTESTNKAKSFLDTRCISEDELQARIKSFSFSYIDFLEKNLNKTESVALVNPEVIHALNDCIRTLHHLKKLNNQMISHS